MFFSLFSRKNKKIDSSKFEFKKIHLQEDVLNDFENYVRKIKDLDVHIIDQNILHLFRIYNFFKPKLEEDIQITCVQLKDIGFREKVFFTKIKDKLFNEKLEIPYASLSFLIFNFVKDLFKTRNLREIFFISELMDYDCSNMTLVFKFQLDDQKIKLELIKAHSLIFEPDDFLIFQKR